MKGLLITGGTGKVGFQLLNHFLKKNFIVITTTRDKARFLASSENFISSPHRMNLRIIEVDLTSDGASRNIIDYIINERIEIQYIIHSARCLDYLNIESDNTISDTNFLGEFYLDVVLPYRLSIEAWSRMVQLESVVFISSIYGVVAPTPYLYDDFHKSSPINYGVSKAAQIHLVKELAVRMAPSVRVNCVSFGGVKGRTNDDFLKRYSKLNPMGKMLEESDVAGPLDFLLSSRAENMTGQNLIVDGGWTIW